ncbi:beach-domain-containing protein [Punctularia strigosozonata HHB-11173 SS5]|uniref:Beach-domain-containing protein n=1 Tax=Punctularia strigosozonata (strain HHB-11173) TaxID=741275 RepID=R7S324_PUNST|nr:beach-domain-containing protein [Punctularia strigosozonata HHB-11173 SS5]EIN04780.1 beach-domain-containing protein [Punctularia strigosozonata HHB-11173 SS5]
MLRSLLTPLTARFENINISPRNDRGSPATPGRHEDDLDPEDFRRDVLIDVMRNSVERLKEAEDTRDKLETLAEIQRIILEDTYNCTKDVFREMDGFLALMGFLSTLRVRDSLVKEPEEQVLQEVTEGVRLVFVVLSEAMHDHRQNTDYFKYRVGYESLKEATLPLAVDAKIRDQTFGCLLSFCLHNFSLSGLFATLRDCDLAHVDEHLKALERQLGTLMQADGYRVLWRLLGSIPDDGGLRYIVLKLTDRLIHASHRNHALIASLGLVPQLFSYFTSLSPRESEPTSPMDGKASRSPERNLVQKLLRFLLEIGADADDVRQVLQRVAKDDDSLNGDLLEVVRSAMKAQSRWTQHVSMEERAAFTLTENGVRGMPSAGFTFMIWVNPERLPIKAPHLLFGARAGRTSLIQLSLRPDGKLQLQTSSRKDAGVFTKSSVPKGRWTHIALVHHQHKAANPTIRLYVEGALVDSFNWPYPKPDNSARHLTYIIGDDTPSASMSWSIASAYLISVPLADDLPRLIHHLGPRYAGIFQSNDIIKYLTYESSTSLNIYMSTLVSRFPGPAGLSPLMKAIRDGLGIAEPSFVFALTARGVDVDDPRNWTTEVDVFMDQRQPQGLVSVGDVFVVRGSCLDAWVWRLGGACVPLRFIQLATTAHELSRSLGVLTDSLRNSWQNSEDMERLRGYDILAGMLRDKAKLINATGFETLFEFLGLNFRHPEQSTITNAVAYLALALDFELWSRTSQSIQRAHLDHFITLLKTSRHKRFNARHRYAKMPSSVVRNLLFVLQTEWYPRDMWQYVIEALEVAAVADFSTDRAIKPIISYLAANLHEADVAPLPSPRSLVSRIDHSHSREKAEHTFLALISILQNPACYTKFAAALPVTRICLLLLGDRPSSTTATCVLRLIEICLAASPSFSRKFELVSGWSILKTVIPVVWDSAVHVAAFDLLLGRKVGSVQTDHMRKPIVCPHLVPAILSTFQHGLRGVASRADVSGDASDVDSPEALVEILIEELIELHSQNPTFRQVFRSQQTTQIFIDAYKTFVLALSSAPHVSQRVIRILEKVMHFAMSLALDNDVAGTQKREILDILQQAEGIVDDRARKTDVDPELVVDNRSVRRRIAARLSLQVGERTIQKSFSRIIEWRRTIIDSERKRLRKNLLDLREHNRQISSMGDWATPLLGERGLWARLENHRRWRLDETEGPYRIRKKLEPNDQEFLTSLLDGPSRVPDLSAPDADTQSVVQMELPPWAESYEISVTDVDGQLAETIVDDKHRRIRHQLEPGDVIEAVSTVARISGIDSSPGLLIYGRTHLYIMDGLVQNDDGEVIDVHDAPKRLFFVPGSTVELDGPQRAQRWVWDNIISFSDRTFLFRDVAMEVYFKDSRSLLVVFLSKQERQSMTERLYEVVAQRSIDPSVAATPSMARRTPIFGKVSARVFTGVRSDELATAQRKWQAREISNFTYLCIINQISGRTPSDATQYPIFPWVIKDYTSTRLDLASPETYRDLSKPMGALTPGRRESAIHRYQGLESIGETPFHYGTHFSSSMIVCHFLIRLEPFTHMFKTLQGGDWDLPDRLFSDMSRAYESASADSRGDVRELIPEFFTCPEFLENFANLDLGVQNTGERIHDVKLPPWAKQDPFLFVLLNREALESDYVSEHLPAWIDLIWGCKQRDPEALNVFHPLSYEGAIDLDSIDDELEKEATIGIIHNFGQTPRKLFNAPHPERYMHGLSSLPIGNLHGIAEDYRLLQQSQRPIRDLGALGPVRDFTIDLIGERIIPCGDGHLCVPNYPHEQVEWGPTRLGNTEAGNIRFVIDRRVVQAIEGTSCTCAAFADSDTLVTGSSDFAVRFWRKSSRRAIVTTPGGHAQPSLQFSLAHVMRAHTAEVTCVAASRAWAIAVSGSRDGSAAVWDLNRGTYVRSMWHEGDHVHLAVINESTGYIGTCSRSKLCLHTINGRPIVTMDLPASMTSPHPPITSMAFLEREYLSGGILATGDADGSITLRTWNADDTPEGAKAQWKFVTLRSLEVRKDRHESPCITALKFVGERLYHGEDTGRTFSWDLPE